MESSRKKMLPYSRPLVPPKQRLIRIVTNSLSTHALWVTSPALASPEPVEKAPHHCEHWEHSVRAAATSSGMRLGFIHARPGWALKSMPPVFE